MLSVSDVAARRQSAALNTPRAAPETPPGDALASPGAQRPGRAVPQEPGPGDAPGGRSRPHAGTVSALFSAAPPPAADRSGPGLVTCAITVRDLEQVPDDLSGLSVLHEVWRPAFPSPDLVALAARQFPALPAWRGEEGPRWRITVSPGALAVGSRDLAKAERTYDRHAGFNDGRTQMIGSDQKRTDMNAAWLEEDGELPDGPGREITEWSRRSRCRMTRRLCELDYTPLLSLNRMLAMLTLTYPGEWVIVAPNGQAAKRHVKALRKRYERTWNEPLTGVWKLEFQDRGAPHFHILSAPPNRLAPDGRSFKKWLSETWASIVGHPDPEQRRRHVLAGTGVDYAEGLRARDPRRIAVYFSKHGTFASKEYQNTVPEQWQDPGQGPGRFWGYWGLERCVSDAEVTPQTATAAARVMRRWARAQHVTRESRVPRARGGMPRSAYPDVQGLAGAQLVEQHTIRYRKVRRRTKRMRNGRGWISLNDAPAFALDLARYLSSQLVTGPAYQASMGNGARMDT